MTATELARPIGRQPEARKRKQRRAIMTEIERLLVTALIEQEQQIDALTEQVGDLVSGQAA